MCEGELETKLTDLLTCLPGRNNNSAKLEGKKNEDKKKEMKTAKKTHSKNIYNTHHNNENKVRVYKITFEHWRDSNQKNQ